MDIVFSDVTLERDGFRVDWEWIGEGVSGEYDPDDPNDVPLLRFSCYEFGSVDPGNEAAPEEWYELDNASYCTRMPVSSPLKSLAIAASVILEAVIDGEKKGKSYKKEMERLSWICIEETA
jgi:hypothetical protein